MHFTTKHQIHRRLMADGKADQCCLTESGKSPRVHACNEKKIITDIKLEKANPALELKFDIEMYILRQCQRSIWSVRGM